MKKLLIGVLVVALGVFSAQTVVAVDANNFTIRSYTVDMTLGKDAENRSTLAVKETIVAEFPNYDQNHGLERAFVTEYDGHSVSLNVTGVTDEAGKALDYHWSDNNLRVGNADSYVHGLQTYVIDYTMRDVTKYYADTGRDEFYWDVFGYDWNVPSESVVINLKIDTEIQKARIGDVACYVGRVGSSDKCLVKEINSELSWGITYLAAHQGVTFAVGFRQGTFAPYQASLWETAVAIWGVIQVVLTPLALIFTAWFLVVWFGRVNRRKELQPIVPEYLPPHDASVTASARVGSYRLAVMAAQMLDLAVRHYIKIYEVKEKSLFAAAEYEIEVIKDVSMLRAEEQELLKDTFGSLPSVGSRMNLKELQNNPSYYRRTLNNDADLDKLIRGDYGFREQDAAIRQWARGMALVAVIISIVCLSPIWCIAALVIFVMSFSAWKLTDSGLALKRYLEGLKMYISVAEEERIRMLQSPEGAEKVAAVAKGTDSAQLIKLYERVLPYAVLFGQEKQWNKQLGRYYEAANTNPDWYAGHTAVFNAAVFSSAMNSFSQANTYASSSSSSSGGSGGGGFSGGGGGGGGGGGW